MKNLDDEDGEENRRADVLGQLFKTILKSCSNKQTDIEKSVLIEMIATIIVEGELEDFLLIDMLLNPLCVQNAKLNPSAAQLVKDILYQCGETDFEVTICNYFNTLFETPKIDNISRVGARWPEVLPQMSHINPSLFVNCIPMISDRLNSQRINATERVRLTQMIEEVFAVDKVEITSEYAELWACFEQLGQNDDQKVREAMIRSCGEIAMINVERRKIILPILCNMFDDKSVVVRERAIEVIADLGLHDITIISDEIINCLREHSFDKKERVRGAVMKCIKALYKKYEPLSPRNKMLTLLNAIYRFATRDLTFRKKLIDVQGLAENIYRAEVLGKGIISVTGSILRLLVSSYL